MVEHRRHEGTICFAGVNRVPVHGQLPCDIAHTLPNVLLTVDQLGRRDWRVRAPRSGFGGWIRDVSIRWWLGRTSKWAHRSGCSRRRHMPSRRRRAGTGHGAAAGRSQSGPGGLMAVAVAKPGSQHQRTPRAPIDKTSGEGRRPSACANDRPKSISRKTRCRTVVPAARCP